MGFFDKIFGKKKPEVKSEEVSVQLVGNFEYVDLGNGTCRIKGRGENRDDCVTTVPAEIDGLKVVKIDSTTFDDYDDLCEVTICAEITEIVDATFVQKANLSKVTLPEGLKTIGNGAFRECDSLEGIIIPDSVTEIGNHAFAWCPLLGEEEIVLPKSLEKIGEFAFYCCKALESIEIPESVTEIGNNAFDECEAFKEIVLPRGIKKIGKSVIGDFENSIKVIYKGTKDEWENVSKDEEWCLDDYTVYCMDGEITVNVECDE